MWAVGATAVGGVAFVLAWSRALQREQTARIRARLTVLTVWTVAILAWPALWALAMGAERANPAAWISLAWPILILSTDVLAMRQSTYEHAHVQSKRSMLSMDANAICSLTFAMASLIGAQRHTCCNRIFLYAVLGCIAFVMPTPYVHRHGLETLTIEAAQKAVLAYAMALLIGGVLLIVSKGGSGLMPAPA